MYILFTDNHIFFLNFRVTPHYEEKYFPFSMRMNLNKTDNKIEINDRIFIKKPTYRTDITDIDKLRMFTISKTVVGVQKVCWKKCIFKLCLLNT